MNKKKKDEPLFYLEYKTAEDEIKENNEIINKLTEKQKSEFVYNNNYFYELGRGHAFFFGFFTEYITKNGIKAWRYDSGIWHIGGEKYDWDGTNNVFIARQKPEINNEPINWNEINFPKVNKLSGPIGLNIKSVHPLNGKPSKKR